MSAEDNLYYRRADELKDGDVIIKTVTNVGRTATGKVTFWLNGKTVVVNPDEEFLVHEM